MELVLKFVVCLFAVAGISQVRGQNLVICYSGSGCRGDDLGAMLPRDCCVSNDAGSSFRAPDSETCSPCIVYGFSQETLTAVEQDAEYAVSVGYWKGAEAGGDFTLDVSSTDGTANEGANLDYTVATTQVEVAANDAPSEFNDVVFSLNPDGVFQEDNETFSIQLTVTADTTAPTGDDVFFLDTLSVTIVDSDAIPVNISFEREVYSVAEGIGFVEVCFGTSGANAEPFNVTVLTVMKEGVDNPATENTDFFATEEVFTLDASEDATRVCFDISIIDDAVYEGDEQFLVVFGDISSNLVDIGPTSQACVTITDDDVPQISIAPASITVPEDISEVEVCITIAGGMLEGNVVVTAETGSKAGAINQATAGLDYEATTIVVNFEPSDAASQTVCGSVSIFNDTTSEPDEVFSIRLVSAVPVGNFVQDEVCVSIEDDDELICHENAEIVDGIEGETFCVCLPGFTGDGVTNCDDIDECATIDDVCADYVNCINVDGSFKCECMQEDGTFCITRDAANMSPGARSRDHTRTHTHRHRHGSGSGRSKRSRTSRSSRCTPKRRSRNMCGCDEGYVLDDMTCKDIDECETGENDCNDRVQCINEPGSFRCVCDCITLDPVIEMPARSRTSKKSKSRTKTTPGPRSKSTPGPKTKSTPGPGTKRRGRKP